MNEARMTGSGPVVPRGLAERAREIADGRARARPSRATPPR